MVLFGGLDKDHIYGLNDTWVWDGSNWTQQFPQASPPERYLHALAYDSAHGQVVLFGGDGAWDFNLDYFLYDTWLWDGSNWTEQFPQTRPPKRSEHALAYDSAHDQTVMFAGLVDYPFPPGDTWTFEAGAPPPVAPSIGSVVSASSYGGFASVSPASFVEIYGSNIAFDTRGWTKADFTGSPANNVGPWPASLSERANPQVRNQIP